MRSNREISLRRRRGRRHPLVWALALFTATVVALAGLWLGLRVAGPVAEQTRLGKVSLRVAPSWEGNVDVFIPIANWGVRAHAFSAPLQLHLEPRSADRQAVIAAAGGNASILEEAREDGEAAARTALLRAARYGIAGAFALACLLALAAAGLGRIRRRTVVGWFAGAVIIAGVIAALALVRLQATFDASAFDRPSFYARGAELAQLLKVAENAQGATGGYTDSVERTLSGYASLLQAGARFTRVPTTPPAILISDLHANTLVLESLKRMAVGGPIFFAGDFGQSGTEAEADLLVDRVVGIGRPMVAVSGNHDSELLMRRLAGAGVIVLTEDGRMSASGRTDGRAVQRVGDLLVAGYRDPLESREGDPNDADRIFSFAERPDGDDEFEAAAGSVVAWFRGLQPRPDVVLIHQNGLAQALGRALAEEQSGEEPDADDDRPLLVLTGHDHKQHVDIYADASTVVDSGTVGAGGIFGAGRAPIGVAQLHFIEDSADLRAIDLVKFEPISGSARADRVVPGTPEACEVDAVACHP